MLKGECALEFKRVAVIDRDLDILAHAVHKILGADIKLVVINVDIGDMVYLDLIALERIVVFGYQLPVFVIFCQCF